jgi:hypothetical protein
MDNIDWDNDITWDVSVSLEFCIPIKLDEKASLWYMLKRLAEYEPGCAKRAHDAMVTGDPLAKVLLKRASQSVIVLRDSAEYCEDEVNKEVKTPTPIEERFHYNPKLGEESRDCEVECNHSELLYEAFEFAASKIVGDGHGITLNLVRGGKYREADAPAKDRALFMTYKTLRMHPGGSVQVGFGGANVPWGVTAMTIPAAPPGVAQQMQRLVAAFGMEAEAEIAWRVITVADGG